MELILQYSKETMNKWTKEIITNCDELYKGKNKKDWSREKIISILLEMKTEKDHITNDIYAEWSLKDYKKLIIY